MDNSQVLGLLILFALTGLGALGYPNKPSHLLPWEGIPRRRRTMAYAALIEVSKCAAL
jgi:hypothetical protein